MSERVRSLKRVLKLRADMREAAERARADTEARAAIVAEDKRLLEAFLNDNGPLGPLAGQALKQVQRLTTRQLRLDQELAIRTREVFEAQRLEKQAERVTADAEQVARADRDRRDLADLIDAMVSRAAADNLDFRDG